MSIQIILTGLTLAEIKTDVAALAASFSGTTPVAETPKPAPSGESNEDKAAAAAAAKAKKEADASAAKAKKEADAAAAAKKLADDKAKAGAGGSDNDAKLKVLRELGMKFVTDQRSAELKELTTKFGIDKVSNCPPERYDELLPLMQSAYDNSAV